MLSFLSLFFKEYAGEYFTVLRKEKHPFYSHGVNGKQPLPLFVKIPLNP
jgi:hypothetical protein